MWAVVSRHHGPAFGLFCPRVSSEITVEVILCKYSRQLHSMACQATLTRCAHCDVCCWATAVGYGFTCRSAVAPRNSPCPKPPLIPRSLNKEIPAKPRPWGMVRFALPRKWRIAGWAGRFNEMSIFAQRSSPFPKPPLAPRSLNNLAGVSRAGART